MTLIKNNYKKLLGALIWIGIIALFFWYKESAGLTFREMTVTLFDVATTTWYGPALYILAYAIRPILFFPATLMTILSGTVFGLWLGFLYTLVGANASAAVAYIVGKFFGGSIQTENKLFNKLQSSIEKNTFMAILFARIAYFPYDLTNYAAGLLRARFIPFITATVIGIIPGTLSFVAIGASIENIETFSLSEVSIDPYAALFAVIIFIFSLGLSKFVSNRKATS